MVTGSVPCEAPKVEWNTTSDGMWLAVLEPQWLLHVEVQAQWAGLDQKTQ